MIKRLAYAIISHLVVFRPLMRALLVPVDFGVHCLVEQNGKVLLIRQNFAPGWRFPGGAVNGGETGAQAVLREVKEEIGLSSGARPELLGIFTRKCFGCTNLIALYHIRDAEFTFKPSFEVAEAILVDPAAPPPDTQPAIRRRLEEFVQKSPQVAYW